MDRKREKRDEHRDREYSTIGREQKKKDTEDAMRHNQTAQFHSCGLIDQKIGRHKEQLVYTTRHARTTNGKGSIFVGSRPNAH